MSNPPTPTTTPIKIEVDEGKIHIMATGDVLKTAVKSAVDKFSTDEGTERFCLYLLTVMKNPSMVESDLAYFKLIDDNHRIERMRSAQIKNVIYKVMAIIGVATATYVATLLSVFVR
jgi:hypothetical protein